MTENFHDWIIKYPDKKYLDVSGEQLSDKTISGAQFDISNNLQDAFEAGVQAEKNKQRTTCAVCGQDKNAPLRIDRLGGYVCLDCVEKELNRLYESENKYRWIPYAERLPTKNDGKMENTSFGGIIYVLCRLELATVPQEPPCPQAFLLSENHFIWLDSDERVVSWLPIPEA